MSHPTDWLMQSRWGINIGFMAVEPEFVKEKTPLTAEEWNRRVDAFDVDGLAAQIGALGVPYCFLTLGQNSGHYCSPNATYDSIVGRTPSLLSRRDLVSDFADALAKYKTRLLVYLPSGAPAMDKLAVEKLKWEWGFVGNWEDGGFCENLRTGHRLEEFQRNWEAIVLEWSMRWGYKVWGWWIDGCYFADEMYRNPVAPNFHSFAESLRAGNPEALVAFNPGQIVPLICHSEFEDYTAGEVSNSFPLCNNRWEGRRFGNDQRAVQWHVYTWIGEHWGWGEKPRLPLEFVIGYTKQVTAKKGVVTWDVPFTETGLIKDVFMDYLQALKEAVPPGRPEFPGLPNSK